MVLDNLPVDAIDWLKDEKNQEKVGNFFKFIAKHWKWVLGAVAGVAALTALGGLVSVIGGLGAALGIFANPLAWKIMAAIAIGYGVWKGGRWIHKKFVGGEVSTISPWSRRRRASCTRSTWSISPGVSSR